MQCTALTEGDIVQVDCSVPTGNAMMQCTAFTEGDIVQADCSVLACKG
jgi:hypothetical protein